MKKSDPAFHWTYQTILTLRLTYWQKKAAEADKTALIAIDQAGNHLADVSYKELDRSSSRFANALLGLYQAA